MKVCPVCKQLFQDEVKFCPRDGIELHKISDELIGRSILDQFIILEKIGSGTMGNVYLAKQTTIDRKVAIKILKPKLASDSNVITRFNREAKAVARLNHPNIVTVYLVGKLQPENLPYIIMEYVEGASLEHICVTQGALSVKRVILITSQIAMALREAHNSNVVHRDLKPANIVVWDQGTAKESIKVLDFGIAKILHTDEERSRLTKTGTIFGTPAYISPEQASGEQLDNRSDLYSLGVIMYRLATGRLPFEDASGLEILVRHIRDIPPTPSSINPAIPKELETVILKLLEKNKEDRYPSAEALLQELNFLKNKVSKKQVVSNQNKHLSYDSQTGSSSEYSVSNDDSSASITSNTELSYLKHQHKRNLWILFGFIFVALIIAVFFLLFKTEDDSMDFQETDTELSSPKKIVYPVKPVKKPKSAFIPPKAHKQTECNFDLNISVKHKRDICAGYTTDFSIQKLKYHSKILILQIYIPGISLTNFNFFKHDFNKIKLLKKEYHGNNDEKVVLHLKYQKFPIQFKINIPKENLNLNIKITYSHKLKTIKHKYRKYSKHRLKRSMIYNNKLPQALIEPLPMQKHKPTKEKLPTLKEITPMKQKKEKYKQENLPVFD